MALGGVRVVPARLTAAGFRFQHPELAPALRRDAGNDRPAGAADVGTAGRARAVQLGQLRRPGRLTHMALFGINLPETARLRLDSGAPELRVEELALPKELEPGRPVRLIDRDAAVVACGVADPENGLVRIFSRQEVRGFDAAFFRAAAGDQPVAAAGGGAGASATPRRSMRPGGWSTPRAMACPGSPPTSTATSWWCRSRPARCCPWAATLGESGARDGRAARAALARGRDQGAGQGPPGSLGQGGDPGREPAQKARGARSGGCPSRCICWGRSTSGCSPTCASTAATSGASPPGGGCSTPSPIPEPSRWRRRWLAPREVTSVDLSTRRAGLGGGELPSVRPRSRGSRVSGSKTSDVRRFLERAQERKAEFDTIIFDPPTVSAARASSWSMKRDYPGPHRAGRQAAARSGRAALGVGQPAARALRSWSTSRSGLRRAGRRGSLLELGGLPGDYPTPPDWPESRYLEVCQLYVARRRPSAAPSISAGPFSLRGPGPAR